MPVEVGFVRDSLSGFKQRMGIHIQVLTTVKITQETDPPQQIADKVFKCKTRRPFAIDFDAGTCTEFQVNRVRVLRHIVQHIGHRKDQPVICEHFRLCGVNRLMGTAPICGEAFYFFEVTLPAPIPEPDAAFADLTEGEHDPGQQVDCLADEDHITSESIAGGVVLFLGARRFKDKWVRCERLAAEHRTIGGNWAFKAFGVDTAVGELTLFLARVLRAADAGDVAEDVSEPAAEDVAFGGRHLQRFFDGVGEVIACKAEVLKHGFELFERI